MFKFDFYRVLNKHLVGGQLGGQLDGQSVRVHVQWSVTRGGHSVGVIKMIFTNWEFNLKARVNCLTLVFLSRLQDLS